METHLAPGHVIPFRRQLWSQIHRKRIMRYTSWRHSKTTKNSPLIGKEKHILASPLIRITLNDGCNSLCPDTSKKPDSSFNIKCQPNQLIPPTNTKKRPVQTNTSKQLSEDEVKGVQNIVGTLIYCSRCVYSTLAAALSKISSEQANETEETRAECHQILDYVVCHENAEI